MRTILTNWIAGPLVGLALLAASCGSSEEAGNGGGEVAVEPEEAAVEPESEAPDPESGEQSSAGGGEMAVEPEGDAPLVLGTTSIWADVTSNLACDGLAVVEAVMEPGVDPHGFSPSLADRAKMEEAALIVANGLGLEEGLVDTLDAVAAAGTPVFHVTDHVETIDFGAGDSHDDHADEADGHDDHDDHADEADDHADHADEADGHDHDADGHDDDDHADHDHADEAGDHDHDADGHDDDGHDDHAEEADGHDHDAEGHDDDDHADHAEEADGHDHADEADDHDDHADEGDGHDHAHDHTGADPHVWFDPVRVSGMLAELAGRLTADAGLDPDAVGACLSRYQAELAQLHDEVVETLAAVAPADRRLITNHDALGYFADRYGFEVIATVIPGGSTLAEPSTAALGELADLITETGLRAIFAEQIQSADTIESLAARAGPVEVATLYTGALGPPGSGAETYAGFMRTNARIVADALS